MKKIRRKCATVAPYLAESKRECSFAITAQLQATQVTQMTQTLLKIQRQVSNIAEKDIGAGFACHNWSFDDGSIAWGE
jgi:hypothetical protein